MYSHFLVKSIHPLTSSQPTPSLRTTKVATTRFILPCIENTLVDAREAVIASGLRCLAALAGLGLLPRHALPSQATPAAPLLQHPGLGVRAGAAELIVRVAEALGALDTQVFLYPVLIPHLRWERETGVLLALCTRHKT